MIKINYLVCECISCELRLYNALITRLSESVLTALVLNLNLNQGLLQMMYVSIYNNFLVH